MIVMKLFLVMAQRGSRDTSCRAVKENRRTLRSPRHRPVSDCQSAPASATFERASGKAPGLVMQSAP